jgi:hypothetical protein
MWSRILVGVLASALAASAAAVSAPAAAHCRVLNGEKLPADSGGASAICSGIEQAVAAKAPQVAYKAEVRVLSKSGLAVSLEVGGRKLEEQHFGIMDRNINPGFIKRVAEAVADQVAEAAKKS